MERRSHRKRSSNRGAGIYGIDFSLLAVYAILISCYAAPLAIPASGGSDSNPLRQFIYVIVLMLTLIGAKVTKYPQRLNAVPLSLVLMITWCAISLFWSISAENGMRRLMLTIIIIWSIFLAVQRIGAEKTQAAMRQTLLLLLIASYAAVFIAPGWAIHNVRDNQDPSILGAWRGVAGHKNFAGPLCAFTVIVYIMDAGKLNKFLRALTVIGAAYFLYRTQSKTSIGFLILTLILGGLYNFYNPRFRIYIFYVLGSLIGLAALFSYVYWDKISEPFQDPNGFTGRVEIWQAILTYWNEHWLLGSGYGSFWNSGPDQPIMQYSRGWVSEQRSGHNGYIDLMVQTGILGAILGATAAILWPVFRILSATKINRSRGALILTCILFAACHNLTESSLFERDHVTNVFLMFALALLRLEIPPLSQRFRLFQKNHRHDLSTAYH